MTSNSPAAEASKVYLLTLGCPKNEADSRQMMQSFLDEGFSKTDTAEEADVIVINSCTFIDEANQSTVDAILDAAEIKRKSGARLVVAGCFSQRFSEDEIKKELPEVDFTFGTGKYGQAGRLIRERFDLKNGYTPRRVQPARQTGRADKPYTFLKLSEGCNRGCSFCIIPHIRGKMTLYDQEVVLAQARQLLDQGYREIGLVSQDTTRHTELLSLLDRLDREVRSRGTEAWLRLYYLYPDKKTAELIERMGEFESLVPYLDMPVQHVAPEVLREMNRSGNVEFYSRLFSRFRELYPHGEVRTSFILGYPAEKEEQFQMLADFIEEVEPDKLALFVFSPQKFTPAADWQVYPSLDGALERRNELERLHSQINQRRQLAKTGSLTRLMLDHCDNDGTWFGHRDCDAPEIDGWVRIEDEPAAGAHKDLASISSGEIVTAELLDYFEYEWTGRLSDNSQHTDDP